jgi:hypothetical protein
MDLWLFCSSWYKTINAYQTQYQQGIPVKKGLQQQFGPNNTLVTEQHTTVIKIPE